MDAPKTAKRRRRKTKRPSLRTIIRQMNSDLGGVQADCEYGCYTDPDSQCEHGKDSWALIMGLI